MNRVYLSGILADDPEHDTDRHGDPMLLLRVAFPAPDTREDLEGVVPALELVEVPEKVAERHREDLRLGAPIFFTGQLGGGGSVIATEIHTGPADLGAA